jgi:hypothetical protein
MGRKIQDSYDARPTRAQLQWQDKIDREREAAARAQCKLLRVWRACRKKPCRRAHSCKGNMEECFDLHWRALPEEARVWLRAGIKARIEGLSPNQAAEAADAEVARHRELTARYEAAFADTRPGPVAQAAQATAAANKPALPRARGL